MLVVEQANHLLDGDGDPSEVVVRVGKALASAPVDIEFLDFGAAAQLIVLGDREFDIYSQFVRVPPGVHLIARAAHNRRLADDERLFDAPSDWRDFGIMDVRVPPSRPGEPARPGSRTRRRIWRPRPPRRSRR